MVLTSQNWVSNQKYRTEHSGEFIILSTDLHGLSGDGMAANEK